MTQLPPLLSISLLRFPLLTGIRGYDPGAILELKILVGEFFIISDILSL